MPWGYLVDPMKVCGSPTFEHVVQPSLLGSQVPEMAFSQEMTFGGKAMGIFSLVARSRPGDGIKHTGQRGFQICFAI